METKMEMKRIQVFDKPMCCATGVCGPQVDPVLPQFAADLKWLETQGVSVQRYNLAQQPGAFADHDVVREILKTDGVECLPLVLVDDRVMSRAAYPSRAMLAKWTGMAIAGLSLPILAEGSDCCGGESC